MPISPRILIGAAIILGLLGRSIELVLPVIINAAGRDLSFSNSELGLFAGAELAGVAIASLVAFAVKRPLPLAPIALFGAVILGLANALSAQVDALVGQLALRFIAGAFGEGALLVAAVTFLGASRATNRVYAAFMAAQMAFGVLALGAFGVVDQSFGFPGVMRLAAVLCVAGIAVAWALPWRGVSISGPPPGAAARDPRAVAALTAMGVFHAAISAVWTFLQQKSIALGFSPMVGGAALSVTMAFGLVAALYVVWRPTPRALVWWSCVMAAGAASIGAITEHGLIFIVAGAGFMIAWNLAVPHQIALLGRDLGAQMHLRLVPGVQGVGLGAGPVLAGLVSAPGDYGGLALFATLAFAASGLLFYQAAGSGRDGRRADVL